MPNITILSDLIASQIAAGEVVERPASAIKELVENSLDAESTSIEISLSKDCLDFCITDDGYGMDSEDCKLAFYRHATSKIKNFDDLSNIASFGFRGEALNSIASVAKICLTTRVGSQATGNCVKVFNDNIEISSINCPKGTKIDVNDLFFNVPARKKFLKKPKTEFAYVFEIVQAMAIANSQVKFELTYDNRVVLATTGSGNILQAGLETNFIQKEYQSDFTYLNESADDFRIEALLSSPKIFKQDRKGILTIVNNRVVRCPVMLKVLDKCYADLIPRQRYPISILLLNLSANSVDVNIHPTKKEIRYSDGVNIFQFLFNRLKRAVDSSNKHFLNFQPSENYTSIDVTEFKKDNFLNPVISYDETKNLSNIVTGITSKDNDVLNNHTNDTIFDSEKFTASKYANLNNDNYDLRINKYFKAESNLASAIKENAFGYDETRSLPWDFKLIGYINNTYFLIETQDGLLIVEQHIAHERINYENLLANSLGNQSINQQKLAIPLELNLNSSQLEILEQNTSLLTKYGFDFDLKDNGYFLTAIPITFTINEINENLVQILSQINDCGQADKNLNILKSIACQSAIKNGMTLNNVQIIDLLTKWYHTPRNDTCPHGRPIAISLTYGKLFNMFHPK